MKLAGSKVSKFIGATTVGFSIVAAVLLVPSLTSNTNQSYARTSDDVNSVSSCRRAGGSCSGSRYCQTGKTAIGSCNTSGSSKCCVTVRYYRDQGCIMQPNKKYCGEGHQCVPAWNWMCKTGYTCVIDHNGAYLDRAGTLGLQRLAYGKCHKCIGSSCRYPNRSW